MKKKLLITFLWALLILALDIATKQIIIRSFQYNELREITSFFNLVFVINTGGPLISLPVEDRFRDLK
jgi:lipoprotein signal peptidase